MLLFLELHFFPARHLIKPWDVTVVSTTAESYVAAATRRRGEAANMAATRKCQKYSELSTAYQFLPIAVETLGPMNDSAYEFSAFSVAK